MHLQVSTKRYKDQVYKYARVVQSVRPPGGQSTQKVLHNFGRVPELLIEPLRKAVKAANEGRQLHFAPELGELLARGSITANLRYLELAVLDDCWQTWSLTALLDELAGPSNTVLRLSQVILPLVLRRCVDPGSKLGACRWFPSTALPEMLSIPPEHFNNTRVHRALDQLYRIDAPLQSALVERYQQQHGPFVSLFMDVTDTYFEGVGCETAELTRTKSEMPNKRCLAIALLANQDGYPMQWLTVGGKTKDWDAMRTLIKRISERDWLTQAPLVMDRAMGNPENVAWLKRTGVRFLTAAHVTSIETYTTQLDTQFLDHVALVGTDESYEDDIKRVAQAARDAGLVEIHEQLFVVDLGVSTPAFELLAEDDEPKDISKSPSGLAGQLQRALLLHKERIEDKLTHQALAARHNLSSGRVSQLLSLVKLTKATQRRILERGSAVRMKEEQAWLLYKANPAEQLAAIDAATQEGTTRSDGDDNEAIGDLCMAAYFNPRLFVDIRRRTSKHCEDLNRCVEQLNRELRAARRSRKRDPTYNKLARELRRYGYLNRFDIDLEPITVTSHTGRDLQSFQFTLTRKEDAWRSRRKYDGFVLLLGHPDLDRSALERVELYRAKDAVEKDFQVIKSVVELRPIYVYSDPHVQAHVTICMLALLLERTLRKRLKNADLELSASACLELLRGAHLNHRQLGDSTFYDLTRITDEQRRILKALDLTHLANQEVIDAKLFPRPQ